MLLDLMRINAIPALHWLACFIVLAEGLNKLERTQPLQRGLQLRVRVVVVLKVLAWLCLVVGAAGGVARPFIGVPAADGYHFASFLIVDRVSLVDFLSASGFALLIVRSRFKECTS
jgi:hypothetical protein